MSIINNRSPNICKIITSFLFKSQITHEPREHKTGKDRRVKYEVAYDEFLVEANPVGSAVDGDATPGKSGSPKGAQQARRQQQPKAGRLYREEHRQRQTH